MEDIDVVKTAEDGANPMEVLEQNLNDLEDNSKTLLESIEQLNLRSDCYVDELAAEISKLEENVENTLGPFWQRIKNEMFDAKCYIKKREAELEKLEAELENQKNVVANLRNELKETKATLFHQSSYTASLGATLCTLLWSACGDKLIAVELLKQRKLVDLLGMIPDSLKSFFESFGENLPSVQSKEYQFILSMIGIVTNISAVFEGRTFLTNCPEGDRCIRELLEIVFEIPQSGVHIQRTVLMVLYNMSLNKRGIKIIQNDARVLPFLVRKISQVDGKLRYVSLRLFQSLVYHVKNVDFVETLHDTICSIKLEELQQHCKDKEKKIIAQIIGSVESARKYLQSELGANGTQNGLQQLQS